MEWLFRKCLFTHILLNNECNLLCLYSTAIVNRKDVMRMSLNIHVVKIVEYVI